LSRHDQVGYLARTGWAYAGGVGAVDRAIGLEAARMNRQPAQPSRPTWLEISRSALTNNVRRIKTLLAPTCRLMAVVKANAYGHGDVETARTLADAGADAFAVAALGEALSLRQAGIAHPLLVMGYTPAHLVADAVAHDVVLTVYDMETAAAIAAAAQAQNKTARVHVKVNTGMNRLGVEPDAAAALLRELGNMAGL